MKRAVQMILIALMLTICSFGSIVYASTVDNSKIILESYEIVEPIYGGSEFELHFTLRNTSNLVDAYNITMSYVCEKNAFLPSQNSSNSIVVGSIRRNGTYEGSIKLFANDLLESNYYKLLFTFGYQTEVRMDSWSESEIALYLSQNKPLLINNLIVQDTAYSEAQMLINVNYVNSSKYVLEDVKLHIDAEISSSQKIIEIGSVSPGEIRSVEAIVTPLGVGTKNVTVKFSFTDITGETVFSDEKSNYVNVIQNEIMAPIPKKIDYGNEISIGACALLAICALVSYSLARRNQSPRRAR